MARPGMRRDLSHPLGVLGQRVPATEPVGLPWGVWAEDVALHEAVLWARGDGPGRMAVRLTAGAHVGRVLHGPSVDASCDLTGRVELTGLSAGRAYDAAVWFEGADGTRGEVGRLGFRTASASRTATSIAWLLPQPGGSAYTALHHANPDVVIDLGVGADPTDPAWRALRADVPFVDVRRGARRVARGPLLDIVCPGDEVDVSPSGAWWTVVAGSAPEAEGVLSLGDLDAESGTHGAAFGRAGIARDGMLTASLHDSRGELLWRTEREPAR